MSIEGGGYARGDLLNGCHALVPGLKNAYGYVPSFAAGIVFDIVFLAMGVYHIVRSVQKRRATSYLLAIAAYIEHFGWMARTWSSKCAYNKIAFLLQITTLVVAPIFVAAAIYVALASLIRTVGQQYSVIRPKLYLWIFLVVDVLSLVIQGGGGALASGAANKGKDTKPGANLMVAGIIFQLVSMSGFCILFAIFLWRTRRLTLLRGERFVIYATTVSVVAVYIRCIYRTIELLEGWDGMLMKTEGFFIGLDGVCIVIAIAIFCIFDPAVLLATDKMPLDAYSNELTTFNSNR